MIVAGGAQIDEDTRRLRLKAGPIQYGQSRTVALTLRCPEGGVMTQVTAEVVDPSGTPIELAAVEVGPPLDHMHRPTCLLTTPG